MFPGHGRRTGREAEVARLLAECFNAVVPKGRPAFILFIQTFGDLVTWQPHIHALVADGAFQENGVFRVLPPILAELLEQGLREAIFEFLKGEGASPLTGRDRAPHPGKDHPVAAVSATAVQRDRPAPGRR